MKRIVSEPQSRAARRLLTGGGLLGLLLVAGAVAIGDVDSEAKRAGVSRQSLSLFSSSSLTLRGNQVQCGLRSNGDVCTNVTNSPTAAGGAWPAGTPNAYIFNTGLQIAGIMDENAGQWANDTVGAYFFDARGTEKSAEQVTEIYNSLDPDDALNWPADAIVQDTAIFDNTLLGRVAASQQDSWVRYWDGNSQLSGTRTHPMGILVTQRSLAWNYPSGNESILYFIYNFKNVTDSTAFQEDNELRFCGGANCIPDEGVTINEVYAAFGTDMDVTGDASANYSTAIYPFDLGISYHGGFDAPEFDYVPSIFFPPFFTNAPGIVGIKYLRSPVNPDTEQEIGLCLFTVFQNCSSPNAVFCDSRGDKQLWRYLSGKVSASQGDQPCSVPGEVETGVPATTEQSLCFITENPSDTRFLQVSGPFSLAPGQEATIVVAYIMAATVATLPDGSPTGIVANAPPNANPPGLPSFHPGYPSARGCDENGENCTLVISDNPVKPIERGAGWVSYNGPAPDGRAGGALEGPENKLPLFTPPDPVTGAKETYFDVVPGSLLGRALVAQTIFDNKFLLGFAPEQPIFYLVPGNNSVTVVWEPSVSEELGDPFYNVAQDPASPLYNPNYRGCPADNDECLVDDTPPGDVEGYQVWRGTTPSNIELIAQFDYANTSFVDYTCETIQPSDDLHDFVADIPEGERIGYATGEDCPFALATDSTAAVAKVSPINSTLYFNNGSGGGLPGAGVVRLLDGTPKWDSQIQVGVTDFNGVGLGDTGVPFVFTDNDVTNNFTYFYAVSAFDVNSVASGPASLSSARVADFTVPRNDEQNLATATLEIFAAGDDGEALDISAPLPSLDPNDGTFNGSFPPVSGVELAFNPVVQRLLGTFTLSARIDSMVPFSGATSPCPAGVNGLGTCWQLHYTVRNLDGSEEPQVIDGYTPVWGPFGEPTSTSYTLVSEAVPLDPTALEDFGIPPANGEATATSTYTESIYYSNFEGQSNRRGGSAGSPTRTLHGGARWFDGDEETTADPTKYIRVGHLSAVDTVWSPIHHTALGPGLDPYPASGSMQCWGYSLSFLARAADFRVTWQGGTIQVRDVTHNVDVPYDPNPRLGWGFLNTDANGNGLIDWQDFDYLDGALENTSQELGFCTLSGQTGLTKATLDPSPTIQATSTEGVAPGDMAGTGQGFALLINGQIFVFETDALPADGTEWTLRSYTGGVIRTSSESTGTDDPSGYTWNETNDMGRPANVPGLSLNFQVEQGTRVVATFDLDDVHTVPDPYLGTSQYDRSPTSKQLQFVNLPPRATIRIYTLTGVLVDQIEHDDATGGGRATWDIRNRNNQFVASGVYFYHVVTQAGDEKVGK
ncbi:MAG: hypothetical protein P8125_05195, partial [Gemmatimonadota bacterium]